MTRPDIQPELGIPRREFDVKLDIDDATFDACQSFGGASNVLYDPVRNITFEISSIIIADIMATHPNSSH